MRPYDRLAPYFGAIFPCSSDHRACYDRLLPEATGRRVLDIGYGTGEHLAYLAGRGAAIYGIEVEQELVDWARRRFPDAADHFRRGDMLTAGDLFACERFDLALLVGNTLAHADGPRAVAQVLAQMARLVARDGVLVASVVNYDRVLAQHVTVLPPLQGRTAEGRPWQFHRSYDLAQAPQSVLFRTRLIADEETVVGEHALYPVRRKELESAATAAFQDVHVFGGYRDELWSEEAFGTVVVARGPGADHG